MIHATTRRLLAVLLWTVIIAGIVLAGCQRSTDGDDAPKEAQETYTSLQATISVADDQLLIANRDDYDWWPFSVTLTDADDRAVYYYDGFEDSYRVSAGEMIIIPLTAFVDEDTDTTFSIRNPKPWTVLLTVFVEEGEETGFRNSKPLQWVQ